MEQQLSVLGIDLAKQVFPRVGWQTVRQSSSHIILVQEGSVATLWDTQSRNDYWGKPAERYLQSVSNINNIRSINMLDLRQLKPQYVTNEAGEKTAIILPLEAFEELLEDIEDLAMIAERREEPTMAHDQLVAELKRDGLI